MNLCRLQLSEKEIQFEKKRFFSKKFTFEVRRFHFVKVLKIIEIEYHHWHRRLLMIENFQGHSIDDSIPDLSKRMQWKIFLRMKILPLTVLAFLARICLEIVRIRVKCAMNWSMINLVCFLCMKSFVGKSPQEELRTGSCWFCVRRRRRIGETGDFCRNLLLIGDTFFDGDWPRWWTIVVGDGERPGRCLRDLVGLRRVFNKDESWREGFFFHIIYDTHKSSVLVKQTSTTVTPVEDFVGEYDERRSLISVAGLISRKEGDQFFFFLLLSFSRFFFCSSRMNKRTWFNERRFACRWFICRRFFCSCIRLWLWRIDSICFSNYGWFRISSGFFIEKENEQFKKKKKTLSFCLFYLEQLKYSANVQHICQILDEFDKQVLLTSEAWLENRLRLFDGFVWPPYRSARKE